jgi:hypothetical protein
MKKVYLDDLINSGIDYLIISISKEEIINMDFSNTLHLLNQLTSKIEFIEFFRERVDISIDGYDNARDELWEIPIVRNYIVELDTKFPYWLYFLSKNGNGLKVIINCFLVPFLKPLAAKEINGKRLQEYLEKRGFLAMNQLCKIANLSEEENIEMTNRLVKYLNNK